MLWLLLACVPEPTCCEPDTADSGGFLPYEDPEPELTLQIRGPDGALAEGRVIWFDDAVEYAFTTDAQGEVAFQDAYDHGVFWVFGGDLMGMHFFAGGLTGEVEVQLTQVGGCSFEVEGAACAPQTVVGAGEGWSFQPPGFDPYSLPDPGVPVYLPTPSGWEPVEVVEGRIHLIGSATLSR